MAQGANGAHIGKTSGFLGADLARLPCFAVISYISYLRRALYKHFSYFRNSALDCLKFGRDDGTVNMREQCLA